MLSPGEPRDVAVNFDTYQILHRHRTCGFLATARLSCRSLSADCYESSVKSDVYFKKNQSDRIFNASHDHSQLLPSSFFTANVW